MKYIDNPPMEEVLMHYGINHEKGNPGSGRYPWGSGDSPYQHSGDFLSRVKELRSQHLTFTDERKQIEKDGKMVDNPDYGKTFTGETAVAKALGMDTVEYRNAVTLAKNEARMDKVNRAEALHAAGYGYSEIARKMGLPNESSVRALLDPKAKQNMMQAQETADFIKDKLEELAKDDPKAMIDIGPGVERELGITRKKLDDAIYILEGEGYKTGGSRLPNITDPTGANMTTLNVIGMPTMEKKDPYDYEHINSIKDYISRDNGETYVKRFQYPESLDSSRLQIRYEEDGGKDKDGVIELRRGVPDLSLGESNYAQVRIMVDGTHYLKGMALYSDNMPDGVDVIFNTNKSKDVPMMDVLKPCKIDKATGKIDRDNPFGSLIKDKEQGGQYEYEGPDGKKHLGLINKRADEGDWDDWKDTLASQFLSKQPKELAKRQLNLAIKDKQEEFKEIMALNNNTVKKIYLEQFANDCDSDAVHLKAAALPRQKFQVILPLTSISENEVYAPNYQPGEKVALVRYPHGGTFEIPILTVTDKNREGIKVIGKNSTDAIGINSKVAERLSGADFDGDTVMVIPTNDKIRIKNQPPLKDLEGFDPKTQYKAAKVISKEESKDGKAHYYNAAGKEYTIMKNTNTEMGKISNLITDMTIKGADEKELARAVKHSMVVIDAEKHKLDYRSSYIENDIAALKKKYQGTIDKDGKQRGGASTLISAAKSPERIIKTQGQGKINIKGTAWYDPTRPEGALIFKTSDKASYQVIKDPVTKKEADVYKRKDGSLYFLRGSKGNRQQIDISKSDEKNIYTKYRTQNSNRMSQTDDARTLISDRHSPIETIYADYANALKSMANEARKALYFTKGVEYSPSAAKTYAKEVESLGIKLDISMKNKPRERQAQIIANSRFKAKEQANPDMTKEDKRKVKQQEISRARDLVGAKRELIDISEKEWEAIQAGAIHANTLEKILSRADMDVVRERATPSDMKVITDAKRARIESYAANGKTNAEIAMALGISASTVSKVLNGPKGE